MKNLIAVPLCLLLVTTLNAQVDYQVSNFEVTISGTSTLHDWEANVETVSGTANILFENNRIKDIESLNITITAKSIKSEKGNMMDKNIYNALKTDKHKNITFQLTEVVGITNETIRVKGNLTIAGNSQEITLSANSRIYNGNLTFEGIKPLKMTDYKVQPPEFMLGAMKTGDEVTINFKVTLANSGLTRK